MFDRILNATLSEDGVSASGVNSLCLQILIHTKHKTTKQCLALTALLHFLEEAFIHWVDKAMCYQQSGKPIQLDGEILPPKLPNFS